VGVWGFGYWAQPPIPNPQSPIPNPHYIISINNNIIKLFINNKLYIFNFNEKIIIIMEK
jgi:hypothetical protein